MDPRGVDCPVCPARGLRPDQAACPGCGTDLTPIWRVRELAAALEESPAPAAASGVAPGLRFGVKVAVAALALWVPVSLLLLANAAAPGSEASGTALPAGVPGDTTPELSAGESGSATMGAPEDLLRALRGIQGVTADLDGGRLRVAFDAGVFARGGDVPTPEGLRALGDVAGALARVAKAPPTDAGIVTVEVVGTSDDRPTRPDGRWTDNWSLGLARAGVAAVALRAGAAGSPIQWRISSSGDSTPRWPNDTETNRARNRTVMLYVERVGATQTPGARQVQP